MWYDVANDMKPFKPFKAPSLVDKTKVATRPTEQRGEPVLKKRRIDQDSENDIETVHATATNTFKRTTPPEKFQLPARKPLLSVPSNSLTPSLQTSDGPEGYYAALW